MLMNCKYDIRNQHFTLQFRHLTYFKLLLLKFHGTVCYYSSIYHNHELSNKANTKIQSQLPMSSGK